ncbi:cilia- and flagella-associated protein 47 [Pteronotus mesoamericanus]|uniref:cilia- and flagella-associated protein 47 n=1 Tax=Pteronotus mesoamericanus TaxID=1884717 RepID=UPI0023ED90A6|nr:cilia- and flagella-associated protein 47 [Pteronotus parnellii mesoamericanus]
MSTRRASLLPRDVVTPKELQLRMTPSELKFQDTMAGKVYRQSMTIHNLGRTNQKIRFLEPVKPQFKVILPSMDKELASGLQMTAMVEYHPNKDENTFDQLCIVVGNKAVEIPLIGLIPTCQLEIEPEVDFGTVVANSKVYCKEIKITNHGKVKGIFTIEYQGQLPIAIFPTDGIVEPMSSTTVKVDFCADQLRVVNEVAKVILEGHPEILLNIKVHVVEQIFELLNENNTKVECIYFGSAYFGTSKIRHAYLYNNSPASVNWVAIIQNDSVGEELGTNIQQRTDVAINNLAYLRQIRNIDITTFMACFPNEGSLLPYEKIKITFCFSPKLTGDHTMDGDPSHRQDYVVFLRFDTVGSKDGFLRDDNTKAIKTDRFEKLELALTGSGLPVVLQFDSGKILNFAPCSMGEQSEVSFTMENLCKSLPVIYHFKKIANFRIDPERGKVGEGCMQKVTCSFIPHQFGVFKVKQFIEIIGLVADENFHCLSLKPFHQIYLVFKSTCVLPAKKTVMKINRGIPPLISSPTEQIMGKDLAKYKEQAPVTVLPPVATTLHIDQFSTDSVTEVLLPVPNDQAASAGPRKQDEHSRTTFPKIPRQKYVDPEYAYTDSEILKKKAHNDYYKTYIEHLRNVRLQKQAERKDEYSHDDNDTGEEPKSGLKSPSLSQSEIEEDLPVVESEPKPYQLLCTRNIESREVEAVERKVLDQLKSNPSTPEEEHDCSLILTPRQIHQVIVGPSVLNFGDVCVNSMNTHHLHVVNMLPRHVLIKLDVNLKELQNTKQFSYVIPPSSSTYVSIIFQTPTTGKYWKSFTFTVNNIPGGHLLVMAIVMPVRLELSSNELVLKPRGFLLQTYFRETVRLYNHQNYIVYFEWMPLSTKKGIAFSIFPVKGTVEPFSSLECEVTWHPGFSSPETGGFILHVDEGNTLTLKCVVKVGSAKVLSLESKILFYDSPQGLTTWKKVILQNVGQNHAFYKVCKKSLLPTIDIVPPEGIIPFGGLTSLYMSFTPSATDKFETKAKIAIRYGNDISLRVAGSAEVADVEIKPNVFFFSGTFVGGTQTIPFLVRNKTITRVRVEFNLEGHQHFSMKFKKRSGNYTDPSFPKLYYVELEGKKSTEGGMIFSPDEVRVYDFVFQVRINFYESSELYTEYHLLNSPISPNTVPLIQPCYVQAVVLQAPLKLSSNEFIFDVLPHTVNRMEKITKAKELVFRNLSRKTVDWALDIRETGNLFKDGTFKFSELSGTLQPYEKCTVSIMFCPRHHKKYTANVPVRLNDNPTCYQMIHLVGEIKLPTLLFDPPGAFFTPVPLEVLTMKAIKILPQNYYRDATLSVLIPPAKFDDDDEGEEEEEKERLQPLSVQFPKGTTIKASPSGISTEIICYLSFLSRKPVSFITSIVFCDNRGNGFSLPVTATAENCILTIYSYMAAHVDTENLVLSDGIETPAEILNSDENGTSKEEGAKSMEAKEEKKHFCPEPGTDMYYHFQKVVSAAQTWFSLFGWPEGPHSLSIPVTIRRDVSKMESRASGPSREDTTKASNSLKYNKTIYDVIQHLSGKMPDGIHPSQSLPTDCNERVIQLYKQHASVLDFLSAHGACLSHVLPEFLFEPEDYKKWIQIREKHYFTIDMSDFEAWSKRAWTDVFLQIYKVLILSQVVPHTGKDLPSGYLYNSAKVNPCFEYSNIYSDPERILLSWMNTHYENTRHVIWENCRHGNIPGERWIIDFDKDLLDGLVFATVLGAYCPFLIEPYFVHMYTEPKNDEQRFHNCLLVVNSLHEIGLSMGIQASDIWDPSPILMLMLCVYMYERLPAYIPKDLMTLYCTLHETVIRQILVKNSSQKTLIYRISIIGRDAADFSIQKSRSVVTISPRGQTNINVLFTSRFLHPAEASLMLISKSKYEVGGAAMIFTLKGEVHKFHPVSMIKCRTPCYKCKDLTVKVTNPFNTAGDFKVILVESSTFLTLTSQLNSSRQFISQKNESDGAEDSCGAPQIFKTSIRSSLMREFFSPTTLHLKAKGISDMAISFVPFDLQTRYCIIILSNRKIGELIYAVEGKVKIPSPSSLPAMTSLSSYTNKHIYSPEVVNRKESVLYLKCKPREVLDIDLILPLTNEAKEKALAFAAQRQMTDVEYQRRRITGTLESSSIRVAIAVLGLTRLETSRLFNISKLKQPKSILYLTEVSLPAYFEIPKKISIPQYPEIQAEGHKPANKKVPDGSFLVHLRFAPLYPGRYPCRILLVSNYDVRQYYIEGVVGEATPEGGFKFESPTFQPLTQKIPIGNETWKECKYRAFIEGERFFGPSDVSVGPRQTLEYPLTFKPLLPCEVMAKLILQNKKDGTEHAIALKGVGKRPVALEHIVANCKVGIPEDRIVRVPNYAKNTVTYKVSSDLPILWGNRHVTVAPFSAVPYALHISSGKRGVFKGKLSFFIKSSEHDDSDNDSDKNQDQEQKQSQNQFLVPIPQKAMPKLYREPDKEESDSNGNLRLWYDLEIHIHPEEPVNIIEIQCVAMETVCFAIPLCNIKEMSLNIEVVFSTPALSGLKEFVMNPQDSVDYAVCYSPSTTGCRKESIIFQPDNALEFWYLLKFVVELPKPTTMPEVQCDLGKYVIQTISLANPTHETLTLQVESSNPDNFILDSHEPPLTIPPYFTENIPIRFRPSVLGRTGQQGCINFYCEQFEEWKFYLSGVGLFPQPLEVERMTTFLNQVATTVILFENPTEEDVFINVILTSRNMPKNLSLGIKCDSFLIETSVFRLGLSRTKGVAVPPREIIYIPVHFTPRVIKLKKTMLVVQMMRANGKKWPIDNFDELSTEMKRLMEVESGEIQAIRWIYPIIGLPEAKHEEFVPVVVECPARKQIEKNLEVSLTGDFFGEHPIIYVSDFVVIPKSRSYSSYEDIDVLPIKREFEYEILYKSEEVKSYLEPFVSIYLRTRSYNVKTQTITLDFNVIFSPKRPLRTQIILRIECKTDGVWNFPITLIADDPEVDGVIDIAGIGLLKESVITFCLSGQKRCPDPFTAYFLPESDPGFSVKPQSGELPPYGADGIPISVGFTPVIYGRKYRAKLVIQTLDMYRLYLVNGVPEAIMPPRNVKAKIDTTNKNLDKKQIIRHNFVIENTNIIRTGVSSPIKGAPLMLKKK